MRKKGIIYKLIALTLMVMIAVNGCGRSTANKENSLENKEEKRSTDSTEGVWDNPEKQTDELVKKQQKANQEYIKVIKNEEPINILEIFNTRSVEMQQLSNICESMDYMISSYYYLDLNNDGIKELILGLKSSYGYLGDYEVLFYDEQVEQVYGITIPPRGFNGVNNNGIYLSSGGAQYNYYCRLDFSNGMYYEETIASMEGDIYKINGNQEVSEEEYHKYVDENCENSDLAEMKPYNSDNLQNDLGDLGSNGNIYEGIVPDFNIAGRYTNAKGDEITISMASAPIGTVLVGGVHFSDGSEADLMRVSKNYYILRNGTGNTLKVDSNYNSIILSYDDKDGSNIDMYEMQEEYKS